MTIGCVRDPLLKSILEGFEIEKPRLLIIVTAVPEVESAPAEGVTVRPRLLKTSVEKLPLPLTVTVLDAPQAIVSEVGVTVNVSVGVGVTASPLAPCNASKEDVSMFRPLASVTINATFPQPVTVAVNLPPLVPTLLGDTVATPSKGEVTT